MKLDGSKVGLVLLHDDAPRGLSLTEDLLGESLVPLRYEHLGSPVDQMPELILVSQEAFLEEGPTLVHRLHSTYKGSPIVVFGASEDQFLMEECWRQGADGFVLAPFDRQSYLRVLDKTVRYWFARKWQVDIINLQWSDEVRVRDH